MKPDLELLILALDFGLAAASLRLARALSGSVFANIPRYMLVLASALIIHSLSDILLSGGYATLAYGLTALIASASYLLLIYGVYSALKKISGSGGPR